MSRSQTKSIRILSPIRMKDNPSMDTTQSYLQAHRFKSPRSTRAQTEPNHNIDSNLVNIMNQSTPNRLQKLLRTKGFSSPERTQSYRKSSKFQSQIFDRAYSKEKERITNEIQQEQLRKKQLREKLGLCKKPKLAFYKIQRNSLSFFEKKFGNFLKQGRYKQRLHPVCWLYEESSQKASKNPICMQNPFSSDKN